MSYKKKSLGQHFLKDHSYRSRIAEAIITNFKTDVLVEIGPGEGAITELIIPEIDSNTFLVELDDRFAPIINERFGNDKVKVIHDDILKVDWSIFGAKVAICGNFPYNISSQILFKILEHRDSVQSVVAMFQKEVAERVVSKNGSKTYGILSVLLGAFYDGSYLFTIPPEAFNPPPKVDSGMILLKKKKDITRINDFKTFKTLVKLAFHTRRKKLSNSLKSLNLPREGNDKVNSLLDKRPEHLTVDDFIFLANLIS